MLPLRFPSKAPKTHFLLHNLMFKSGTKFIPGRQSTNLLKAMENVVSEVLLFLLNLCKIGLCFPFLKYLYPIILK